MLPQDLRKREGGQTGARPVIRLCSLFILML